MTDTSSLSHLIERLETATDGSRELDALIECEVRRFQAYAVGLNDKQRSHWKPVGSKGEVIDAQRFTRYHAPLYSESIDAAMTLVPEGWFTAIDQKLSGWVTSLNQPDDLRIVRGGGKTEAIARTCAALKAQLSTRTNEQDDARNLSGVSSE